MLPAATWNDLVVKSRYHLLIMLLVILSLKTFVWWVTNFLIAFLKCWNWMGIDRFAGVYCLVNGTLCCSSIARLYPEFGLVRGTCHSTIMYFQRKPTSKLRRGDLGWEAPTPNASWPSDHMVRWGLVTN